MSAMQAPSATRAAHAARRAWEACSVCNVSALCDSGKCAPGRNDAITTNTRTSIANMTCTCCAHTVQQVLYITRMIAPRLATRLQHGATLACPPTNSYPLRRNHSFRENKHTHSTDSCVGTTRRGLEWQLPPA